MVCLSCRRPLASREARLWENKLLLCPSCDELAKAAKARLEAAQRQAEAQAHAWLEQSILRGDLLEQGSEVSGGER